jgi:Uncharacterized protein conserved in bacteria
MSFADNLAALPDAIGARLRLHDAAGNEIAVIENAPGTAGSFKLYAHLAHVFGAITPAAAQRGVDLYAEHSADARTHPGKHPNIDRLFACIASGDSLSVSTERD